jgi:hypothetical protein
MSPQVVEQVIKAGATTIMIPDTVGWQLSPEYSKLIAHIKVGGRQSDVGRGILHKACLLEGTHLLLSFVSI